MMEVTKQQVATVKHAEYRECVNPMWDEPIMRAGNKMVPPTIDALYLVVDHMGEECEIILANTGWNEKCVALQFMAFCGAKPSDLEPIEGTMIKVVEHDGRLWPHDVVIEKGAKRLKQADWFDEDA